MILDSIIKVFRAGDYPYDLIDEFYIKTRPDEWYLFICESATCIVRYKYTGKRDDAIAAFRSLSLNAEKDTITNNPHDEWHLDGDTITIEPWENMSQSDLWDKMITKEVK